MTGNMLPNGNERLDRIERIIESLARGQENLLQAVSSQGQSYENLQNSLQIQGQRINILIEGQLGLQAQMGVISDQTLQLKRAVDYLLSRDGGAN